MIIENSSCILTCIIARVVSFGSGRTSILKRASTKKSFCAEVKAFWKVQLGLYVWFQLLSITYQPPRLPFIIFSIGFARAVIRPKSSIQESQTSFTFRSNDSIPPRTIRSSSRARTFSFCPRRTFWMNFTSRRAGGMGCRIAHRPQAYLWKSWHGSWLESTLASRDAESSRHSGVMHVLGGTPLPPDWDFWPPPPPALLTPTESPITTTNSTRSTPARATSLRVIPKRPRMPGPGATGDAIWAVSASASAIFVVLFLRCGVVYAPFSQSATLYRWSAKVQITNTFKAIENSCYVSWMLIHGILLCTDTYNPK